MWTVSDALEGCGGVLQGSPPPDEQFSGISIDTRTIQRNNLFFALSGPNFDGHRFVDKAIQKGGSGAVVSSSAFSENKQKWLEKGQCCFFIIVDKPLEALQAYAKWHRARFDLPLLAISGSNGKTTTKEMLAAILGRQGSVLKNKGNLNNHIGLPLSLLNLNDGHSTAVLEMGISQKGEMERLCNIARPTVALITNIGSAHLEGLGSLEGVAEEKSVLFQYIKDCGAGIINRDDPFLKPWEDVLSNRWTFSVNQSHLEADITASHVIQKKEGTAFLLHQNRTKDVIDVNLPLPGRHQVSNALAAAAAASSLGLELESIEKGLSRFKPLPQRAEIIKTKGITILFDAYNANPDSVKTALELLSLHAQEKGQKIALFGEMLELGDFSESAHYEIGKLAASHGVSRLIALGKSATIIAEGARASGFPADAILSHQEITVIGTALIKMLRPGDTLLIKGSRGSKLERLLPLFGVTETERGRSV